MTKNLAKLNNNKSKNNEIVQSMLYINFNKIVGLLNYILIVNFSIRLLKNILIVVAVKDNKV